MRCALIITGGHYFFFPFFFIPSLDLAAKSRGAASYARKSCVQLCATGNLHNFSLGQIKHAMCRGSPLSLLIVPIRRASRLSAATALKIKIIARRPFEFFIRRRAAARSAPERRNAYEISVTV